jgi:hypothetical protein
VSAPLPLSISPHSDPVVDAIIAQLQQQVETQAQQLDTQSRKIESDARELEYARLKIQGIRPAEYTVDGGAIGMREVFRRVFLSPRQWA